jgi:DNA-3-methyladenine glycosylase
MIPGARRARFRNKGISRMGAAAKTDRQLRQASGAGGNIIRARPARRLTRKFFERPTLVVARELLGKTLVRRIGKQKISVVITETEAYIGEKDLACHARFGRTKRNAVMYGAAGVWYPYFIYGMHWMLNVTTEGLDEPAAILIRAGRIVEAGMPVGGPGKLTKTLRIDGSFYGKSATSGDLYIEDRGERPKKVLRTPRIGIDYAGEYKDKKWRFVIPVGRPHLPIGRNDTSAFERCP